MLGKMVREKKNLGAAGSVVKMTTENLGSVPSVHMVPSDCL